MSDGAFVRVNLKTRGLEALKNRLNRFLRSPLNGVEVDVGAEVLSQVQRRIQSEKTSPDGKAWADWSPDYAKTRHSGQSLLQGEGNLLDSLSITQQGGDTLVGSNLVYAATHQYGDASRNIKDRKYLGVNEGKMDSLLRIVDDWVDAHL
jgi:phage virion morphogenesis protein